MSQYKLTEVIALIRSTLVGNPIASIRGDDIEQQLTRLAQLSNHGGRADAYLRYERAWSVDTTIYVNLSKESYEKRQETHWRFRLSTELSWGSTTRGVAESVAAIHLYTQATQLAALLEASINGLPAFEEEPKEKA